MTISAYRSRLIWSPLLGWVLLSCGIPSAQAQSPTLPDVGSGTTATPSVPAGGAAPIIVTPGGTSGTRTPIGPPTPGATTPADATLVAPSVPSAGTTIVNAPFGASVPYFGGITSVSTTSSAVGGTRQAADETGIGLGAFNLYPQLDVSTGLDSNVFAQAASLGPTASMYTTVSPSFELRSDWSNHLLRVLGSASFGFYPSAPTQNFQNYSLIVDGKVDIHRDMYVTGRIGFRRATEALGTPNVAFAQAPTVADTLPLDFTFHQEFNDFFYEVGGAATRFWYYDNSTITSAGLPAQSRNRFEYSETLRLGYHLNEDIDLYISPSLQQVRYIEKINTAGQQRDSDGSNFGVGATWRINPISMLQGDIGLQTRNDPTQGATSALSYGLRGTWTGYAPLTIRPTIMRAINETALSNYNSYVSTTYAFDFTYEIHNEWTLAGGLLFQTADYNPAAGANVGPRTDYFMRSQVGLLYSIKPEIQIGPFIEYSKGSSTDSAGPNYDRQIYSIRLIAKR